MANGLGDSRTEISSALLSLFHEITKMVHAMVGNLTEQSELWTTRIFFTLRIGWKYRTYSCFRQVAAHHGIVWRRMLLGTNKKRDKNQAIVVQVPINRQVVFFFPYPMEGIGAVAASKKDQKSACSSTWMHWIIQLHKLSPVGLVDYTRNRRPDGENQSANSPLLHHEHEASHDPVADSFAWTPTISVHFPYCRS